MSIKLGLDNLLEGYMCPVCAFTMSAPADDFNICPCCGTEFGNDDRDWSYDQLRVAWLENGAHWWSALEHSTILRGDQYFEINGVWYPWPKLTIAEEELCPV